MNRRRISKLKQRRLLYRGIGISTVVLIVLIVLLLCVKLLGKDDLEGTWGAGDMIVEFDGRNKGVWIGEGDMERFDYKLKDDTLFVDFRTITDCEYTVSFVNGTLLLTDPEGVQLHLTPLP